MLEVYQYQANGQPLQQWETYYHYDAAGRVDRVGNQSAITPGTVTVGQTTYRGYNDTFADLVDQNTAGDDYWLSTSAGLVEIRDYDTSVSPGYITANKVHQGWTYPAETNAITVNTTQYTSHQADSSFGGGTVYPMASSTEYRNTDGTGAEPGKGTQFVSGVCNSRNELRALFHPANRRRSVTATREVELPNPQQRKGYGP